MASRKRSDDSCIIVLSTAEVAFLTKVTNGFRPQEPTSPRVRKTLHDRLLDLESPSKSQVDRYVFPVNPEEIEQLHKITKSAYNFITEGERRARLVLREKMAVASDELGVSLR